MQRVGKVIAPQRCIEMFLCRRTHQLVFGRRVWLVPHATFVGWKYDKVISEHLFAPYETTEGSTRAV